jgi:hypothetical protein
MRVFLSWSGDKSKAVAALLDEWLQCVLQAVQPWMSAEHIESGAQWFGEIGDALKDVTIGIVCLTKANREKPWILFEAGALARGLSTQRVITFLVDLQPTDIGAPLSHFNHSLPTEEGLRKILTTINLRLGERALNAKTLERVFQTYWPQFSEEFQRISEQHPDSSNIPAREESEKIDEILGYLRSLTRERNIADLMSFDIQHSPNLSKSANHWFRSNAEVLKTFARLRDLERLTNTLDVGPLGADAKVEVIKFLCSRGFLHPDDLKMLIELYGLS